MQAPPMQPSPLRKGYEQLLAEARARIRTLTLDEAASRLNDSNCIFIDVRDVRELEREGMIPGAFHAPRGMLEFWADPASPYFKPVFGQGKELVLYCQSAWRSALAAATLTDMGVAQVTHFEGGFSAWKQAGLPIAQRGSGV
jgi:rhodanese-related sulfurtransferase